PIIGLLARKLHTELNAVRESSKIGRYGNTTASLSLPDRDRIDFGKRARIGEDRAPLVELSHFGLTQMAKRFDPGGAHLYSCLLHPFELVRVTGVEQLEKIPAIGPLKTSLRHAPFDLPEQLRQD